MKNLFLILPLYLFFLVSCDSGSSDSLSSSIGNSEVDPRLQVYLDEFLTEADRRGVTVNGNRLSTLSIQFGELESGTLGICSSSSRENVITVSTEATEDQFRWVVVHELGHCILRMEHRDNTLSAMNSALSLRRLDSLGEEAVYNEFFQERFFEAY